MHSGKKSWPYILDDNLIAYSLEIIWRGKFKKERSNRFQSHQSVFFFGAKSQTGVTKQKSSATWYKELLWEKIHQSHQILREFSFFPYLDNIVQQVAKL
jgi:hypothetical protein